MLLPIKQAIVSVRSTKRNTFYNLIDVSDQKVKISYSLGSIKSNKRNTYADTKLLAHLFVQQIIELKYKDISFLILRGLGAGRSTLVNAFRNSGLRIGFIQDCTLTPHNGCRPPKIRRKKFRTRTSFKIKKLLTPGF